jgi:hypothetical protein
VRETRYTFSQEWREGKVSTGEIVKVRRERMQEHTLLPEASVLLGKRGSYGV